MRHLLEMSGPLKSPQTLRLFPEKLFYKIGEASRLVGVEPYVLRYWETEFPSLRPRKSKSGQRVYTRRDLDLIVEIKQLLYDEKYTIDGARKRLGSVPDEETPEMKVGGAGSTFPQDDARRVVRLVKEKLEALLRELS